MLTYEQRDAKIAQVIAGLQAGTSKRAMLIEVRPDGDHPFRPFLSDGGQLCVFQKGARRYGSVYMPDSDATDIFLRVPVRRKSEQAKWCDSWLKVVNRLEDSGL